MRKRLLSQLNSKRRTQHLPMIATIAITVARSTAIAITQLLRNPSFRAQSEKAKGGTWRFPLLSFCCVVSEAR